MTTRRWLDWVNVILGLWLIASPRFHILGAGDSPAAWSVWSLGAGVVMLAGFSMYRPAAWADAVGVMFGMWLIASPWMLGFTNLSAAAMNAVIVGVLVVGYAFWAMRIDTTRAVHSHDRRPA